MIWSCCDLFLLWFDDSCANAKWHAEGSLIGSHVFSNPRKINPSLFCFGVETSCKPAWISCSTVPAPPFRAAPITEIP
ncbi:hypothetical protein MESS4_250062 [Mesorhizobium sp. STM 4661]|nr:hypothetical protein MESS4_250062 [Mesorhizobium sp. STM 4661]